MRGGFATIKLVLDASVRFGSHQSRHTTSVLCRMLRIASVATMTSYRVFRPGRLQRRGDQKSSPSQCGVYKKTNVSTSTPSSRL